VPTQTEVDNYLTDLRGDRQTADTLYTNFTVEVRLYPDDAIQLYMTRPVLPGESDGTYDTVDEPGDPFQDDYRLRDEELASVANEMRGFGATVQYYGKGDTVELYAVFKP